MLCELRFTGLKAGAPTQGVRAACHERGQKRRTDAAQWRLRFDRSDDSLPRFWQLRFHDFNVWSHKKRVEKLQYMHLNPVKRGLVAHPRHWPWSSFSFYANPKPGLVPIDPVQ